MRVIFAGTPEFAAKALEALIQSEHEVVMVLSQPDRPAGRGRKLKESAVKALAKQHNIPVYTPLSLRVEKGGEETAEVLTKMQEAKAEKESLETEMQRTKDEMEAERKRAEEAEKELIRLRAELEKLRK